MSEPDGGAVVIPDQAKIAVFLDGENVVLHQDGQHGPDEDEQVFIARKNALAVAVAILKTAGLDLAVVPWTEVLTRRADDRFPEVAERARRKIALELGRARKDIAACIADHH